MNLKVSICLKAETEKIISVNLQEQIYFKTTEEQKTDTLKIDSLKNQT
jgi:hypothetical protein